MDAFDVGDRPDRERHQVGRVRPAAERHRRQERRVRLDQEQVERRHRDGFAKRRCVAKRDVAGERHDVTGIRAAASELGVTAETVEDHAIRCTFVRQHAEHVVVRVAVMDHERLAGRFRNRDVPTERLLLRLPPVPTRSEVIEPRLPHRDNLRMNRK